MAEQRKRVASFLIDDGNSGTAITVDFSKGPCHKVTLTGAATITIIPPIYPCGDLLLEIHQSGTFAIAGFSANSIFPANQVPKNTLIAGKVDLFRFNYNGTVLRGTVGFNYPS